MRARRVRRRPVLWLLAIAVVAAGSAYLASNTVPPSSAGDRSVSAHVYTYDDTASAITYSYSGTWLHAGPSTGTAGDYNGTISSSQQKGATATIPFAGTTIQWIGERGPTAGIASVYVTTVLAGTVDAYSPTQEDQAVLFSTTVPAGTHTLTIMVTGTKSPTASGDTVYIDAINVP